MNDDNIMKSSEGSAEAGGASAGAKKSADGNAGETSAGAKRRRKDKD